MNVLFAYGFCGLGGVETSLLNRCEALHRRGVGATVFFGQFYGTGGRAFASRPHVVVGTADLHQVPFRDFDAVCVVDYPSFIPIAQRACPGAPLLLETHASITTRLKEFHRLAADDSVRAVVVPSNFNRDLVLRESQVHDRVHVIPNCIDTEVFLPRFTQQAHARFGVPRDAPVVLWIGRLEDEKDPHEFVALACELAQRSRFHFICIGDAPQDPAYESRLVEAIPGSVRPHFTFLPRVTYEDMPLFYSLAAVTGGCLVSTSRFEAVPMTFIEAMACRCPVVSTDVGGVSELVEHGRTGVLFPVADRRAATSAVIRLVADRTWRAALVDAALAHVRARHSLAPVGERFSRLLESVVEWPHLAGR